MIEINKITREEFEVLPVIHPILLKEWYQGKLEFDALVILHGPNFGMYRQMDFVAVIDGFPKCRLSGCSDIIQLNNTDTSLRIKCLAKSGLLYLWSTLGKITCGEDFSVFEIRTISKEIT